MNTAHWISLGFSTLVAGCIVYAIKDGIGLDGQTWKTTTPPSTLERGITLLELTITFGVFDFVIFVCLVAALKVCFDVPSPL